MGFRRNVFIIPRFLYGSLDGRNQLWGMENIIKVIFTFAFLFLASLPASGQKPETYLNHADEVQGKHTIYTEIIINAPPEVVREKFLAFEKWPSWNSVITEIAVKTGNIDSLETKPTLGMTFDFNRKKDPAPAPLNPEVYANDGEAFVWGFDLWYLKANHVHFFEPIENGTQTRFINYEEMNGWMRSFVMTKKRKANMTAHFIKMNEELRSICQP